MYIRDSVRCDHWIHNHIQVHHTVTSSLRLKRCTHHACCCYILAIPYKRKGTGTYGRILVRCDHWIHNHIQVHHTVTSSLRLKRCTHHACCCYILAIPYKRKGTGTYGRILVRCDHWIHNHIQVHHTVTSSLRLKRCTHHACCCYILAIPYKRKGTGTYGRILVRCDHWIHNHIQVHHTVTSSLRLKRCTHHACCCYILAIPYKRKGTGTYGRILVRCCLLYTSDAADERSSVDLGGRRIIKKKTYTSVLS